AQNLATRGAKLGESGLVEGDAALVLGALLDVRRGLLQLGVRRQLRDLRRQLLQLLRVHPWRDRAGAQVLQVVEVDPGSREQTVDRGQHPDKASPVAPQRSQRAR